MADRRFILCPARDLLVVVNYKCGYATLNRQLAENPAVETRNLSGPLSLWRRLFRRNVLFYRNPYERFASFYNNWIVNKTQARLHSTGKRNYLKEFILPSGGEAVFERFTNASKEERATTPFLREFLTLFEPHVYVDGHTQPQHMIYSRVGLPVSIFRDRRPTTQTVDFLAEEFGVDAQIFNVTGGGGREELRYDEALIAFCNRVYARDFADFDIPME